MVAWFQTLVKISNNFENMYKHWPKILAKAGWIIIMESRSRLALHGPCGFHSGKEGLWCVVKVYWVRFWLDLEGFWEGSALFGAQNWLFRIVNVQILSALCYSLASFRHHISSYICAVTWFRLMVSSSTFVTNFVIAVLLDDSKAQTMTAPQSVRWVKEWACGWVRELVEWVEWDRSEWVSEWDSCGFFGGSEAGRTNLCKQFGWKFRACSSQ